MNKKKPKNPLPFLSEYDILCPHFQECSGCEISKNVANPQVLEEARVYFAKKGIDHLDLIVGKVNFWRYRAKLVVRGTCKNPEIGLYKKGTHEVLDIPFCKVHHKNINLAVSYIKDFIKSENIEPYNETTKKGLLRYIQLVLERSSGKVQLTFVLNTKEEKNLKKWELNQEIWHSIWLNFNETRTNNIFGRDWAHVKGAPFVFERFGETEVYFHPASFAQANLDLFEKMLDSIYDKIHEQSKVVEFYAGVGVIGLKIANKCQTIVCSEVTPQAEICFLEAKSKLNSELAEKISFQMGPSEKQICLLSGKDVCIVDPPRKGLDSNLLKAITFNNSLEKIIYVSCGWKAFQRDCDFILASNNWKIAKIEPYLFFPGSNHIEILAVFERV